jgi:hypothetical protein
MGTETRIVKTGDAVDVTRAVWLTYKEAKLALLRHFDKIDNEVKAARRACRSVQERDVPAEVE